MSLANMDTVRIPIILPSVCQQLDTKALEEGWEVERFEVRFGDRALAACGPELLREVWQLRTVYGVPVSFPEEPCADSNHIEIRACGHGGLRSSFYRVTADAFAQCVQIDVARDGDIGGGGSDA